MTDLRRDRVFGLDLIRATAGAMFVGDVVLAVAWAAVNYRWFERPLLEAREAMTTRLGIARIER